ncbi:MAG: PfkB family carbohydrate kinase [Pseudomonadota bacterium]
MSLLVVGALHWDVVVAAPQLPRLGETLPGGGVDYRLGGKGGNQAIAAARAGAKVAFAGRVGQDAPGQSMAETLTAAGVDTQHLQRGPGATGMSVAITVDGGDYGAVIVSGENHAFEPGALVVPNGCRIVLAQNEMAPGLLAHLSRIARAAGARFWLNLAPAAPLTAELAAGLADLLVVNRIEAGDLLGPMAASLPPAEIADALHGLAPRTDCIVTLGDAGAAMKPNDGPAFHRPARAVAASSTHGAGDVFCGALAAAHLAGRNWPDAVETAQHAAARHVAQSR